jgi:hypothetical protein
MAHIDALRNYEYDIEIIPDIKTGIIMLQGGEIEAVGTGSITANHFIEHGQPVKRLDIQGPDEHLRFSVNKRLKKELDSFIEKLV